MKASLSFSQENQHWSPSTSPLSTCVFTCVIFCWCRDICVTWDGGQNLSGSMRWGQGRERFLFWGWKRLSGSTGMPGNPGRSNPSQSCSVLSGKLAQPKRDLFSLCMLTLGRILCFLCQVPAGHTSGPGAAHSFPSHSQENFPNKEEPQQRHFSLWQ